MHLHFQNILIQALSYSDYWKDQLHKGSIDGDGGIFQLEDLPEGETQV
jgi:hypothetical protein